MKQEISLDYLFKKIITGSGILSGVVICLSAVMLVADVVARFVIKHSIAGVTEFIIMFMVWIAYFSISYTLMEHGHIQMTSFTEKYHGRAKYVNEIVIYLCCFVFFIFLTKVGYNVFTSSVARKEVLQASVKIYAWIGKLPILVGSVLMVLQAGAMLVASVINFVNCKYFQSEPTETVKEEE